MVKALIIENTDENILTPVKKHESNQSCLNTPQRRTFSKEVQHQKDRQCDVQGLRGDVSGHAHWLQRVLGSQTGFRRVALTVEGEGQEDEGHQGQGQRGKVVSTQYKYGQLNMQRPLATEPAGGYSREF